MASPIVVYIPNFLSESVAVPLPPQVAFPQAGLEGEARPGASRVVSSTAPDAPSENLMGETSSARVQAQSVETLFRARLPLARAEARAVLAEMLSLGNEYAGDGSLLQRSILERLFPHSDHEQAALKAFAHDGSIPEQSVAPAWGAPCAEDLRKALIDCQKTLLLARELELRQAEIRQAHERSLQLEERLLHALHGAESDELLDTHQGQGYDLAAAGTGPLPWRAILDAVLPFVSEDAVFFTADPAMAVDLRELGMLQPFPEDRASVCEGWPQELTHGLLLANLPAWRLVGRRFLPPERPWLARDVEIFVARPRDGWQRPVTAEAAFRAAKGEA